MEHREAMEVLGLEASALPTLDRLRRTYLKLVSQHPPERDPEGFKRLRAAFEIARSQISSPTSTPTPAPAPSTSRPPARASSIGPPDPKAAVRERERLVDTINALIQAGNVRGAIEVERRWRENPDNDVPLDDPATLLCWVQMRELLAVVGRIDGAVLRALGAGVRIGHPEVAFPILDDLRARSWRATDQLCKVLAKDAPTIYARLGRPRYRRPAAMFVDRHLALLVVAVTLVIAILVIAIRGGPKQPTEDRSEEQTAVVAHPRALDRSASTFTLAAEILSSLEFLESPDVSSSEQQDAARSLGQCLLREDCRGVRVYAEHLEHAKPSADSDASAATASHIAAIRERVDVLCPTLDSPRR